ncbi:MAG: hypothetical protein GY715_11070 [Planctomycetes bacterium]|nr:hypothetical protein [Planctomycetota bacterium]
MILGQFTVAGGASFAGDLGQLSIFENTVARVIDNTNGALFLFGPAIGACCFDDGTCVDHTAADCGTAGGSWQGTGIDCASGPCEQPGACCLPDGTCRGETAIGGAACVNDGGAYQGNDTYCAMTQCPGAACCLDDGTCLDDMAEPDCTAAGASWQGVGTECAFVTCPQPGACCFSDGTCRQETSIGGADCIDDGGTYYGDYTDCGSIVCPDLCPADLDDSGDVGFGDILTVIGAWGDCPGPDPGPGSFTGLTIEPFVGAGWEANGFTGLTAWRLYANFTDPAAGIAAVAGSATSPMSVTSSDGQFRNDPFDSLTAPQNIVPGYWSNQWDTYVTIGVTDAAGDGTTVTPQFAVESGNLAGDFTTDSEGWLLSPPAYPQGIAGPELQVLLAQFVVAEGETVQGTVKLYFQDGQSVEGVEFPPVPTECAQDLSGNGAVDFADILAVIGSWGPCP